jgi:hypothetical protein
LLLLLFLSLSGSYELHVMLEQGYSINGRPAGECHAHV